MEELLDAVTRICSAFEEAGIPHAVDGNFAIYLHTASGGEPFAHITRKADIAVDVRYIPQLQRTLNDLDLPFTCIDCKWEIIPAAESKYQGAIRIFTCVASAVANPMRSALGIRVVPLADLLQVKLDRFRLEDRLLIQDLDFARLITPEIEAKLTTPLRTRLEEIRREGRTFTPSPGS